MDILALSEMNGVSGNETAVRGYIKDKIKNIADDITSDSMGNIIALKRGKSSEKRLAVTVNMDEPGFIISEITDKGYLKFKAVGNVDTRKIISKKVVVGNNVKGVIGMKAIHLQTRTERENTVEIKKLFIDIGAKDKTEAEKRVKLGDYVAFYTETKIIGENVKGKALDRSGVCAALIDALNTEYPYDVYACFLVQHEVGARGAKIVAHRINADAILTVSTADTTDMYGKGKVGMQMGEGVMINYADKTVIADKRLTDFMYVQAQKEGIAVQSKVLKPFNSDAGAMQYNALPSRCLSAAIPCRYSHSPVSLMSVKDIKSASDYISLFLNKIGEML